MATRKTRRINVSLPLHAWFFFEIDCPICRYVYYNIMLPMEQEGYIRVRNFEINANIGTSEVDWFMRYSSSKWSDEALTPTIKIVDRHLKDYKIVNHPVSILHLWDTKETFVSEEDIETSEILKKQIIESVLQYKRRCFESYHNVKRPDMLMKGVALG